MEKKCNGCNPLVEMLNNFYRASTPEFRRKKIEEQLKTLNGSCPKDITCVPLVRLKEEK